MVVIGRRWDKAFRDYIPIRRPLQIPPTLPLKREEHDYRRFGTIAASDGIKTVRGTPQYLPRSTKHLSPAILDGKLHRPRPFAHSLIRGQRTHVGVELLLPLGEREIGPVKPTDGEQRRLGQREDAREKRGADDLGDHENPQSINAVAVRDQPDRSELERQKDCAGNDEGDQRGIRRQLCDLSLGPMDRGQLAQPGHEREHRVPRPFLEENPQREQQREQATNQAPKESCGRSIGGHVIRWRGYGITRTK